MKKPPLFKILAVFLSVCLLGSDIARAFPEGGITILPKNEIPSFLRIDIPKDLASVEEIYQAPPKVDPRLILHIENVHGNYEAQLQIKKLLQYLHEKYGFKLIFAEGAVEKLNPEYLELFSDKERNLELADRLAKEGELTGIEYFLMNRPEDVEAVGIEKAELYRKNYEAFKRVYSRKAKTETFLNRYDQKLEMLSSRIFGPDLRRVLSEWKKFEKGHREFLPFVKQLAEDAKKFAGTDLESLFSQVEWPQLTRLLVLQSMEADMEIEVAKKERARLVEFLKSEHISLPIIKAIENLGEKQITMSRILPQEDSLEDLPRNLLEKLAEEAGPKGFHFADYPALSLWAGYLILQSELDTKILFREIEKLFEKILQELAVTERQKNLLELYRDADLLRKIFALELSRSEWDRAVYRKEWISPAVMIRRIRIITREKESAGPRHVKNSVILRATARHQTVGGSAEELVAESREEDELFSTGSNHNDSQSNLTNLLNEATHSDAVRPEYQSGNLTHPSTSSSVPLSPLVGRGQGEGITSRIANTFETAFQFYEFARQRETVFYETIEREMSSRKVEKAILVTGGFHTEGLMDIFRQQEINYSVLMPRISDASDKSGYLSSMLETKKTLFDLAQLEGVNLSQRSEIRQSQGQDSNPSIRSVLSLFLEGLQSAKSRSEQRQMLEYLDHSLYARDNEIDVRSEARADIYDLEWQGNSFQLTIEENGAVSLKKMGTYKGSRSEMRIGPKTPKPVGHTYQIFDSSRVSERVGASFKRNVRNFLKGLVELLNGKIPVPAISRIEQGEFDPVIQQRPAQLGMFRDAQEGSLWILKRRETAFERGHKTRPGDWTSPEREMLNFLLLRGVSNQADIRFPSASDHGLPNQVTNNPGNYYFVRVIVEEDASKQEIPQEAGIPLQNLMLQDRSRSFSALFAAHVFTRKTDPQIGNFLFVGDTPVAIDNSQALRNDLMTNDEAYLRWFQYFYVLQAFFDPLYQLTKRDEFNRNKLIQRTWSQIHQDPEANSPDVHVRERALSRGYQNALKEAGTKIQELGLGDVFLKAYQLNITQIRETILAIKKISEQDIRSYATSAHYGLGNAEYDLEKTVSFLKNSQRTLGRDVNELLKILTGTDYKLDDLDKNSGVVRSEVRSAIPYFNRELVNKPQTDIRLGRGLLQIFNTRSELRLTTDHMVNLLGGGIARAQTPAPELEVFGQEIEAARLPETIRRIADRLKGSPYLGQSDARGALEVVTFEEPTKDQIESYAAMLLSQTGQRLHIVYAIQKPSSRDLIKKQDAGNKMTQELETLIDLKGKRLKGRIRVTVTARSELRRTLQKVSAGLFNQLNKEGAGFGGREFVANHFVQLFINNDPEAVKEMSDQYGNPRALSLGLGTQERWLNVPGVWLGIRRSESRELDKETELMMQNEGGNFYQIQIGRLKAQSQALWALINSIRSELRIKSAA